MKGVSRVEDVYVVQRGDTLYGIAKEFDTSVQKLIELNELVDTSIYPGQTLIIMKNGETTPGQSISYTVKSGDNLYNIARKYNTTVDEIKRYNNLDSNNLSIGQILKIPGNVDTDDDVQNYISYVIQSGDSLYAIAKKYGTTVDKIKEDNNLVSDTLTIGNTLLIEDNLGVSVVEECFGEGFPTSDNVVYTVQKGDSLYSIAKKFNTSVSAIQDLNNLNNTNLSIGQELMIPVSNNDNVTYTVQKGESLYSIAKKFNTTVNEIKRKNNLTSNLLSIGQELII